MTTTEAAIILGVTRQHVSLLWRRGVLSGRKIGRDIHLDHESVQKYRAKKFTCVTN